jgi:hypothetical protein
MPHHRVVCFRPDARPVKLTLQGRSVFTSRPLMVVNSSPGGCPPCRPDYSSPPDRRPDDHRARPTTRRQSGLKFMLFLEVDQAKAQAAAVSRNSRPAVKPFGSPCSWTRGRHQRIQPRRVFASPQVHLQLHCHESVLPQVAKLLVNSDFHHYRRLTGERIQILEGFSQISYPFRFWYLAG